MFEEQLLAVFHSDLRTKNGAHTTLTMIPNLRKQVPRRRVYTSFRDYMRLRSKTLTYPFFMRLLLRYWVDTLPVEGLYC